MKGLLEQRLQSLAEMRLGRRFDVTRHDIGWLQRWYAAQPTQRIVVAVLLPPATVTRDELERAVRELCVRHPDALGVCEERSRSRLIIRPLTAADALPIKATARTNPGSLGDAVGSEGEAWELALAAVHQPFTQGAPLFRITLASDRRHIVCAFDHLIADGVSVGIFAAELARLLAGRPLLPPGPHAALPLDARLDLRPSLRTLARTLSGNRSNVLLTPQSSILRPQPLHTRILPLCVPRADLALLLEHARLCGVSLHAVLCAAGLCAALESLGTMTAELRLHTPISLRDRCRPVPSGVGVFIAGIDTDLRVSHADDVWRLALRCHEDLARKRPTAHEGVGLLALAGDLHARASKLERSHHGRTATLEVSNVGRVAGVPKGTGLWLTQGAHYHAALFVLTVATPEGDGDLQCCLSYPEPLVDHARAKRFMLALEYQLQQMRDVAPTSGPKPTSSHAGEPGGPDGAIVHGDGA